MELTDDKQFAFSFVGWFRFPELGLNVRKILAFWWITSFLPICEIICDYGTEEWNLVFKERIFFNFLQKLNRTYFYNVRIFVF